MCKPIAFAEFTQRTLALYSTGKHADATRGHIRLMLGELASAGAATTADLTTDLMVRWIASRGRGANANTINSMLTSASAACSYAMECGWLDRSPNWRRLRMPPTPTRRNAPQPMAVVSALLEDLARRRSDGWSDHRLAAAVWTVALTGLRRNEALCLRLSDVSLVGEPRLVVDPSAQPRGRLKTERSARWVPVPPALVPVLGRWLPEAGPVWLFPGVKRRGPWLGGSSSERPLGALKAAALRVGIGRMTWHSLRHTYGTAAIECWGVPLWVLQRLMGHTDCRTTQRYLHLDDSPEITAATRGVTYPVGAI